VEYDMYDSSYGGNQAHDVDAMRYEMIGKVLEKRIIQIIK
jgi:hypothetical protein